MFCIAAHQRGRLIFPLFPAAALLAGRELAWWLRCWSAPLLLKRTGVFAAFVLGFLLLYHHVLLAGSQNVQTTLGIRRVADRVRATLGVNYPLVHAGTPFALQFWLNTARPWTSFDKAAALLQGNEPVVVAVGSFEKLSAHFETNPPVLHELARWPTNDTPVVRIISNRPFAEVTARQTAQPDGGKPKP